jgi:hypothetical protein
MLQETALSQPLPEDLALVPLPLILPPAPFPLRPRSQARRQHHRRRRRDLAPKKVKQPPASKARLRLRAVSRTTAIKRTKVPRLRHTSSQLALALRRAPQLPEWTSLRKPQRQRQYQVTAQVKAKADLLRATRTLATMQALSPQLRTPPAKKTRAQRHHPLTVILLRTISEDTQGHLAGFEIALTSDNL